MALIKNAEAGAIARDAVVLDLGDLQRQAEEMRARAQREADAILQNAKRGAQTLIDDATARGFEEGRRKGLEQGRQAGFEAGREAAYEENEQALVALLERWDVALRDFSAARDGLLRDAREDVLELAIRLGERVLRREIKHDRGCAARQLESVLELAISATRLRVEVSKGDLDAVVEALPELLTKFSLSDHTEVVEADNIEAGGCRVRSEAGEIDASITWQIERLAEDLRSAGHPERWPETGPSEPPPDDSL